MKHIVSMWRLTLRKVLTALLGASSFLFGTCNLPIQGSPVEYGPGPDFGRHEFISGTVKDSSGEPVQGFWVSILNEYHNWHYTFTGYDGDFTFYIYENDSIYNPESGSYTLFFQDVDGHLNGEYNSQTVQWRSGDGPLLVILEPKEAEPEQ
jgi:hypothetical protein